MWQHTHIYTHTGDLWGLTNTKISCKKPCCQTKRLVCLNSHVPIALAKWVLMRCCLECRSTLTLYHLFFSFPLSVSALHHLLIIHLNTHTHPISLTESYSTLRVNNESQPPLKITWSTLEKKQKSFCCSSNEQTDILNSHLKSKPKAKRTKIRNVFFSSTKRLNNDKWNGDAQLTVIPWWLIRCWQALCRLLKRWHFLFCR